MFSTLLICLYPYLMSNHRQSPHHKLRDAIDHVGSVPCMDCPDVFFPEDFPDKQTREYAIKVARKLCNQCPIKEQCFAYATEADERYGVWAGTLPSER